MPLADMLSNTVGVMVFIFIFTVITAGGATVRKQLPLERPSNLQSVVVSCSGDRAQGFDHEALIQEFLEPLGEPTYETAETWIEELRRHRLEKEGVEVHAEVAYNTLLFTIVPHPASGETADELKRSGSRFRTFLGQLSPEERSIFFFVHPDCLQAFQEARVVAFEKGFRTGWRPLKAGEPLRFSPGGRELTNDH